MSIGSKDSGSAQVFTIPILIEFKIFLGEYPLSISSKISFFSPKDVFLLNKSTLLEKIKRSNNGKKYPTIHRFNF